MKKCAVIIGVDHAAGMTPLSAAVSGAKEFGDWARSAGIETVFHTDENGEPVRVAAIAASVKAFIDQRCYTQMIIFFSGHGILKGPDNEQWLLSEASFNGNEAINVMPSKALARRTGIPHIIFISDTCRSVPNNLSLLQVTGSVIFPLVPGRQNPSDVDIFYATSAGDPALEVREYEAKSLFKGLFTSCLLKGLKGQIPTLISTMKEAEEEISIIESYKLADYLEQEVPLAAEKIRITLLQIPDAIITSRLPQYLSKVARIEAALEAAPMAPAAPPFVEPMPAGDQHTFSDVDRASPDDFRFQERYSNRLKEQNQQHTRSFGGKPERSYAAAPGAGLSRKAVRDIKYSSEAARIMVARGRDSFETRTGFTVLGTNKISVCSAARYDVLDGEVGGQDIRVVPTEDAYTLLLLLNDGTSVPLAILEGFIGTVYLEGGRVVNVNYTPSRYSDKYVANVVEDGAIRERRALIASMARHGQYKAGNNITEAIETGSYLRNAKSWDPTLGLYAAYSYAAADYHQGILSVYDYMAREPQPVLFDVALLAALNGGSATALNGHPAPFCPLLTQGWAYLSINYDLFNPLLKEAARYLIPGLWTTFSKAGTDLIVEQINNQNIL